MGRMHEPNMNEDLDDISLDEQVRCFYCEALVRTTGHGDHFPIPKRNGGTLTVPCCESCHDMKDRFSLNDWPAEWIGKLLSQWHKLSREQRILFAKMLNICSDALSERKLHQRELAQKDDQITLLKAKAYDELV